MDSTRKTLFVDVLLPLAIPNLYTYRVPFELNETIAIGQRVIVQFGKNKMYSAIVSDIHETPPSSYQAKYIEQIIDHAPIVNQIQLKLWNWISSYYMCHPGDVMNAALPSGLKLSSETKIVLHNHYNDLSHDDKQIFKQTLTDTEFVFVEALEIRETLTMDEAAQILHKQNLYSIIKHLIEKRAVTVHEEVKEKYKPKKESFLRLNDELRSDEDKLGNYINSIEKKSPKQVDVILNFIRISHQQHSDEIRKNELTKTLQGSESPLNTLIKNGIFIVEEKEISRFNMDGQATSPKDLSPEQTEAQQQIKTHFKEHDVALLHGVTGSGKTEIYIKFIEEAVKRGEQVLYLLPEIALTTQLIVRLKKIFGNRIGVYHSRFNQNERVEVWNRVLNFEENKEEFSIIIGARSALFLPYSKLGLVIVDEEHDSSYKQQDPAPRYNARDTAIYLAKLHHAKTILGSATPSIESYCNAEQNKYGLVTLTTRFGDIQMPHITLADIRDLTTRKMMKSHFAPALIEKIADVLKNKQQIILFQNRRGFSPLIECNLCAWTPTCTQCDVSLTYHKGINLLRCHYCGYSTPPPSKCGACGSLELKMKGFGTEKIEEELGVFFPTAIIGRMDLDTTRSKHAYHKIITDFEDRKIDILVGTQMISKGLDFDHVSLVGILNADSALNFPDFRSFERSYQLMAQVSGRAGRKNKQGEVIIQTHNVNHDVIQFVIKNDYKMLYETQLIERRNFQYPPFYRLIKLTLKHKDADMLNHVSREFANTLKSQLGKSVLGPETPSVSRIRNYFLKNILIKVDTKTNIASVKQFIARQITELKKQSEGKSLFVVADVDPN